MAAPQAEIARLPSVLVTRAKPEIPLYSLEKRGRHSIIEIGEVLIGGPELVVMAGPCSVESRQQIFAETASAVREAGGKILRGGAFKPRTSPYSPQGLGEEGLEMMREAADQNGLLVVTEATGMNNVELVARYADIIQLGSRNMHSYELIVEAGMTGKPILLKRGWDSTLEEFLNAAEYILTTGNEKVMLCERGIRTPVGSVLDVNSIAKLKLLTHLPIIADPSHAGQDSRLIPALSMAAIAAGADGLEIEVHNDPEHALSDGKQAISSVTLFNLNQGIAQMAPMLGRSLKVAMQ